MKVPVKVSPAGFSKDPPEGSSEGFSGYWKKLVWKQKFLGLLNDVEILVGTCR